MLGCISEYYSESIKIITCDLFLCKRNIVLFDLFFVSAFVVSIVILYLYYRFKAGSRLEDMRKRSLNLKSHIDRLLNCLIYESSLGKFGWEVGQVQYFENHLKRIELFLDFSKNEDRVLDALLRLAYLRAGVHTGLFNCMHTHILGKCIDDNVMEIGFDGAIDLCIRLSNWKCNRIIGV
ncbi:MAG: hypothetical protein HQL64_08090 [Magnetococcales bacterium]|nr:hypothetical protein [Magnetococcales bacterium]